MKLERLFRAFLTVSFAIVAMNLTAPASQAVSPPPMGLYVLPGDNNGTTIVTTHFDENIINESHFTGTDLEFSSNFATGNSPVALAVDNDFKIYTANIGDDTVTKVDWNSSSNRYESCSVRTGPENTGLNPVAISANQSGVITANLEDNTVSSIEFGNNCEWISRIVEESPNESEPVSGFGPVALAANYSVNSGGIVLNSHAKTIEMFDGEEFSNQPYDLNFTDNFWQDALDDDEVHAEDFYPAGFSVYLDFLAVLFDEYLHGTQTITKQHIVLVAIDGPEYKVSFNSTNLTIPNSQRFIAVPDGFCVIASSTTIECWGWSNQSTFSITDSAGIAALATDDNGDFYAANSLTKEVIKFDLDWSSNELSIDRVFQINLNQSNANQSQENSASAPGAPTTVITKTTGKRSATVSFAPPSSNGGSVINSYSATSTPGGITKILTQANGGTFTFDNLQPGTAYTFAVTATNAIGTSVATISNSIKTMPLEVASISALSFIDDGTGTGGKILWSGKSIDSVLYTGPENSYPGPYNYGAFTSSWNGRIRNLEPDKSYTISIFAISVDGVGETMSLTFKTSAALPVLASSVNTLSTSSSSARSTSTQLAQVLKWIEENTFVPGEGAKISGLLTKFDALVTSPHRAYIKVPTSRVTTITATSLTPKACSVVSASAKVDAGLVTALSGDKCTISYTVIGGSNAPATLVKDFIFKNITKK
jgi:hypothetical protein